MAPPPCECNPGCRRGRVEPSFPSASGSSGVPAPAGPLGILLLLLPWSGEGGVAIQFHRRNN